MTGLSVFCLACGLDKIAKVIQEAAALPLTTSEKNKTLVWKQVSVELKTLS